MDADNIGRLRALRVHHLHEVQRIDSALDLLSQIEKLSRKAEKQVGKVRHRVNGNHDYAPALALPPALTVTDSPSPKKKLSAAQRKAMRQNAVKARAARAQRQQQNAKGLNAVPLRALLSTRVLSAVPKPFPVIFAEIQRLGWKTTSSNPKTVLHAELRRLIALGDVKRSGDGYIRPAAR
jgi:hypothetical protein